MNILLQQKQELRLVMTAQLAQSIQLLQFSTTELMQFIAQQQLENPLLEVEENQDIYYVEKVYYTGVKGPVASIEEKVALCNYRAELFELAKMTFRDPRQLYILHFVIFNLDDNGYLNIDETDLFIEAIQEEELDEAILLLQQIGPCGIGARDLQQCLLLQVQENHPLAKIAKHLIQDGLPLLANRDWKELSKKLSSTVEKMKEVANYIKTFNPKPCASLGAELEQVIIPDVYVEINDGKIQYRLNDSYFPDLRFNEHYLPFMTKQCETAKYVEEQYKNFDWLKRSIEQRRITIKKVMEVVVREQEVFFKQGYFYLKPLLLKDVAAEIGMHESTVSRATKNKFIHTNFGVIAFRSLFTTKLHTGQGELISNTIIKRYIQRLITLENKSKPLTDQKITELIEHEYQVSLSRRTINKYRQELFIPSAKDRKNRIESK